MSSTTSFAVLKSNFLLVAVLYKAKSEHFHKTYLMLWHPAGSSVIFDCLHKHAVLLLRQMHWLLMSTSKRSFSQTTIAKAVRIF